MCPSGTGDSMAQAWRIGTLSREHRKRPTATPGPRSLARCGKATWIGLPLPDKGRPVGPFITKPNVETGDMTSNVWSSAFTDLKLSGRGPASVPDCSGASKEDLEHMRWAMKWPSPRFWTTWTRKASTPESTPWNSASRSKPTSSPTA